MGVRAACWRYGSSDPSSKRVVIDSVFSITNQFEVLAEPSITFKTSLTFLAKPSNGHPLLHT